MPRKNALLIFQQWAKDMPRAQLGGLLKEYITESNLDGSWAGFNTRDLSSIRRFLNDIMEYHDSLDNAEELATKTNDANPVP